MSRRVIVVDTETTGLLDYHRAVEVAWVEWRGRARGCFIPPHDLDLASPEALRVNRYHERELGSRARWDLAYRGARVLHAQLDGATLAGANPRFDARMLAHLFRDAGLEPVEPWHYRLLDVQAYAAGQLAVHPGSVPSLLNLCKALGVVEPAHDAADDVRATVEVLDAVAPKPEEAP